jgi:phosphoserine phosphatase
VISATEETLMAKILLVRHGHVEGIEPERFRGRADIQLTAKGRAQAEHVARRIARAWRPQAIYTSPLKRCVATGAAIAQACSIEAGTLDSLNDLDYGTWQFRTFEEIQRDDPERFAAWLATPNLVRFPKGESLQDLAARTADTLRYILTQHPNDTVVLVTHDSVNRVMLLQFLDHGLSAYWRLEQEPCCLNEIDCVGATPRIIRINEGPNGQTA